MTLQPGQATRTLIATAMLGLCALTGAAQGGDKALKTKADALFEKQAYAEAWPLYSQLVSLAPQDHELNYKYGTCSIFSGGDKSKAIGYLRYALSGPATPDLAWYFLGRAYQLDYRFDEAMDAYKHFKGTADKKLLVRFPVDALEQQSRNGKYLLSNLKDIEVLNKVQVEATDYFRFYDLSDIGGKIVVTPDELLTAYDRKSGERFLTYLPANGSPIYFSSYGKDGKTGRDIYRTELQPTGTYAQPRKLSGYINTDQDEDFAVPGPDGKSFYFSSKGHNSMGGYDVFKSIYDPGLDVFSAPENMDFAVNTPGDEMLYIVGPDGTQACFASDRDSRQGQVNVYRVSTTQTPLNLTVFKGVYASTFGPVTKPVRIIVEDEVTRERVADVRSDENGEYVLVLPKGGRYKFLVEDAEHDRTYWTTVEAPPAAHPKAFAQEITLEQRAGGHLDVKNHFDQPLGDDVMALAMDEIRRRARLDVNAGQVVAQQPAPSGQEGDPLQEAGFDGTVNMAKAMELAQGDAQAMASLGKEQERTSNAAMDLAVRNAGEAEAYGRQAAELVARSANAQVPQEKDQLMRLAGEAKQRSLEAGDRAFAAYRTGLAMDRASKQTRAEADQAETLARRIAGENTANNKKGLTEALKELKANLDKRKGPKAEPQEAEKMRQEATGLTEESARQMRLAGSQREDELALADRVDRKTREAAAAKGKKKQDLEAELATLKEQHTALEQEVAKVFTEVDRKEQDAFLARGQVELVRYLSMNPELGSGQGPKEADLNDLAGRLDRIRQTNEALKVDRQYMPLTTQTRQERERRTFDWGTAEALAANPARGLKPGEELSAQETAAAAKATSSDGGRNFTGTTASVPGATTGSGSGSQEPVAVAGNLERNAQAGEEDTGRGVHDLVAEELPLSGNAGNEGHAVGGHEETRHVAVTALGGVEQDSGIPVGTISSSTEVEPVPPGRIDDQPEMAEEPSGTEAGTTVEEEAFLLANRLAELEQLRIAEKNRAKRDSLDKAITAQKQRIKAFQAGEREGVTATAGQETYVPEFTYLAFDMAVLDEELVEEIFPGFNLAVRAIMDGPGTEREKAVRLHALEMQLADSVDGQTERAMHYLEMHPDESADILPRMERWRRLKGEHLERADRALADAGQEYAASETTAFENAQMAGPPNDDVAITAADTKAASGTTSTSGISATPHNDAYIKIEEDLDLIYNSKVTYRSTKDGDAVARKDKDLATAEAMQDELDSLNRALSEVMATKEYNKLQQRVDRKQDDLLIHTVDMGQRMAYISRTEYKVAQDSAKALTKILGQRGLRPDEPLAAMARSFESTAGTAMDQAKSLRKDADNANDIFRRNSLYKQAYAQELKALRDMDRSHTVRNYLMNGKMVPGETLTYEEVEMRMFPEALAASAPQAEMPFVAETTDASAEERGLVTEAVVPPGTAVDSAALAVYLDQYYYLDQGERRMVMDGDAERRYFLMKGRAMQDRADATASKDEADAAAQLAQVLGNEARNQRDEARAGMAIDVAQVERLEVRSTALQQRADSLQLAAGRLLAAADLADAQAAAWMETMPAERSTAIMDLEQTKRRTEPLLARTRPSVVAQPPVDVAPPIVVREEPMVTATDVAIVERVEEEAAPVPVVPELVAPAPPAPPAPATPEPPAQATTVVERSVAPERIAPRTPAAASLGALADRPLASDMFAFNDVAAAREEPIPVDMPMPTGVVYKVQVGAFRNQLPLEAFSDMAPVVGENAGNGLVRYTAGMFTTAEGARDAGTKVRARGYRDAFVVAYVDGQRVPLRQAMEAERMALREATVATGTAQATPVRATTGTSAAETQVPQAPVVAPPPVVDLANRTTQATAEEAVLVQYPATAEELLASFKPAAGNAAYYNDPAAAPAEQVEMVKGLFFTVQVGVYSKPTPLDRLFNITPLNSELTANGKIRYTTGQFRQESDAVQRRNGAVVLGVTDAFVTAYLNGKRIPLRDARALLTKFGSSILADPAGAGR